MNFKEKTNDRVRRHDDVVSTAKSFDDSVDAIKQQSNPSEYAQSHGTNVLQVTSVCLARDSFVYIVGTLRDCSLYRYSMLTTDNETIVSTRI